MAKEENMKTEEIVKILLEKSPLETNDYFKSKIFYYLAGRFPDMTISQCIEVIDQITDKIIEDGKPD